MQIALNRRRSIMVIGLLVSLFLVLGFLAPKDADATTSSERYLVHLINKARAAKDRGALRISEKLSNYARKHSRTMAAKNRLYHNPYLASWLRGLKWGVLGENVGVGGSVYSLHRAFMKSPGHRANNVSGRYRNIGVGIVSSGGRIWITVIFRG